MDAREFDSITRRLTRRRLSRREARASGGTTIAAASLAATGLPSAGARDATPLATPVDSASDGTSYLFVQAFQSGSIAPADDEDGRSTVSLEHGLGQTISFGDRPSRDVGTAAPRSSSKGSGSLRTTRQTPRSSSRAVGARPTSPSSSCTTPPTILRRTTSPLTSRCSRAGRMTSSWDSRRLLPTSQRTLRSSAPPTSTSTIAPTASSTAARTCVAARPRVNAAIRSGRLATAGMLATLAAIHAPGTLHRTRNSATQHSRHATARVKRVLDRGAGSRHPR